MPEVLDKPFIKFIEKLCETLQAEAFAREADIPVSWAKYKERGGESKTKWIRSHLSNVLDIDGLYGVWSGGVESDQVSEEYCLEVLLVDQGNWSQASNPRNTRNASILQEALQSLTLYSKKPNCFVKSEEFWIVRFKGVELPHLRNRKGFLYVRHFLEHPHKEYVSPSDLEEQVLGKTVSETTVGWSEDGKNGQSIHKRCPYEVRDEEEMQELIGLLEHVRQVEIPQAKKNNDHGQLERLYKVADEYEKEIPQNRLPQGLRGRPRLKMKPEEDKTRKRIYRVVNLALKDLKVSDGALHAYLSSGIKPFKFPFRFKPEEKIRWETKKT